MAIVHQRIARAIPATGHDVHVYDFGESAAVILFHDRAMKWQTVPASFENAQQIGLDLAALYDCEMVEHHPYENRATAP